MFVFLSHPLDPRQRAWPGNPPLCFDRDSVLGENGRLNNSAVVHLPNHFGTHLDAPRHFNPAGPSIAELPMEYFAYTGEEILLIDLPKGRGEAVTPGDLAPCAEKLQKTALVLIRTGFESAKTLDPQAYENDGPYLHPETCRMLAESCPRLRGVGLDFLSVGSPANTLATEAHQWLLGCHTAHFVTAIEDMCLSPLKNARILSVTLGPLRVVGIDSAPVSVTAQIEG